VTMLALVPVFGWLCARFPRAQLLPAVYLFFALNLVAFWAAVRTGVSARGLAAVFFVWLSVFNLFVVSVFWSFMADLFDDAQAARLYGAIAAGGSCGAIAGPALTALAVSEIGASNLLIISGVLLVAAVGCIHELLAWARRHPRKGEARAEEPIGGSIVEGVRAALSSPYLLGICAYLLCYTTLSTTLYFQQVEIVRAEVPDSDERTRLFATIDLAVNSLTLIVQLLLTARLGAALGVGWMLALMPIASLAGFAWLGAVPTLAVLIVFGVTRRVGEFAISKPVREALYTVVPREERYKAKNFIDTVIYRGGDAFSGWLIAALRGLGLGVSGIAFAALPVAAGWVAVSFWLGRKQGELRARMN
jgi:ATP:ADP antiporter, AAA family